MMTPQERRVEAKRLKREREDLEEAILAVALAWSSLEKEMAWALSAIVCSDPYDPLGRRLYFTPENAATRFALVDTAFRAVVEDPQAIALWEAFQNSLGRSRAVRNSITHGAIEEVTTKRSKKKMLRVVSLGEEMTDSIQLPGHSAANIEAAADKITALAKEARLFGHVGFSAREQPQELPRLFAELEAHRPIGRDQTGGG